MAHRDRESAVDGITILAFGLGLATGAALGAGLVLLSAPAVRDALRKDVADRTERLREVASSQYHRAVEAAGTWAEHGREVAERAQTAVAEGLREARRHAAAPTDPRRSDLAGVDGLVSAHDES